MEASQVRAADWSVRRCYPRTLKWPMARRTFTSVNDGDRQTAIWIQRWAREFVVAYSRARNARDEFLSSMGGGFRTTSIRDGFRGLSYVADMLGLRSTANASLTAKKVTHSPTGRSQELGEIDNRARRIPRQRRIFL
jgi:hypothetical protein